MTAPLPSVQTYGRIPLASRPDLARLHSEFPERYPALLASQSPGNDRARWDLLLVGSGDGFQGGAGKPLCDLSGARLPLADAQPGAHDEHFLDHLRRRWQQESAALTQLAVDDGHPPFRGGWFVLLGYELAAEIEPRLQLPVAHDGTPPGLAIRTPVAVIHDHLTGESSVVHELDAEPLAREIASQVGSQGKADSPVIGVPAFELDEDAPTRFTDGVERVLEYLAAGDAFQINLSRGWRLTPVNGQPPDMGALYANLCAVNPAPFAASLHGPGFSLLSSSPERLVAVRGRRVETRPIAGTRRRVAGDDDASRMAELIAHPKERAEHIMLIDLERNDLGRICTTGSVRVEELMAVESYAHVHHIESTVAGELREDVTPVDVILALFPGGTITGCPKVRCMEIIAELEGEGRGAYTGAMGYLNHDGDMDLNILIRTMVWDGSSLRLRAGAGIVADSDPDAELAETRAKAHGLLRGLGVTA